MLFSAGLRSKVLLADQRGIEPPPAVNTAAILEWELDIPFTPQDRPPLSIAMIVTVDGARCFRRYRLVIAQKSTASSFSPAPLIENFSMVMRQMVIDRLYVMCFLSWRSCSGAPAMRHNGIFSSGDPR